MITGTELRQARDATAGNGAGAELFQSGEHKLNTRDPGFLTNLIIKYKGYERPQPVEDSEGEHTTPKLKV